MDLLRIIEVAELFGVHYQTVRNWIKSGEMKAVRIGSQYFIAKEEIERLQKGE